MKTNRLLRIAIPSLIAVLGSVQLSCGAKPAGGAPPAALAEQGNHFDGETLFKGIFFRTGPVTPLLPDLGQIPHLAELKSQAGRAAISKQLNRFAAEVRSAGRPDGASKVEALAKLITTPGATADQLATRMENVASAVREDGLSLSAAIAITRITDQIKAEDPEFFDRFGTAIQSGREQLIQSALQSAVQKVKHAAIVTTPKSQTRATPALYAFEEEAADTSTDSDTSADSDDSAASDTATSVDTDTSSARDFDSSFDADTSASSDTSSSSASDEATSVDTDDSTSSARDFDSSFDADTSADIDVEEFRSADQDLASSQAQDQSLQLDDSASQASDQSLSNFEFRESSTSTSSSTSDYRVNINWISNVVQFQSAVQAQLALQVVTAAQFVIAVVVAAVAVAVVPQPEDGLPGDPADRLRSDMLVNALATKTGPVASAADLSRMFPNDQFR